MTREDIALLQAPARKNRIKHLRDSHHHVARLVACGLPNYEIAERCGYSLISIVNYKADPSFQELVARYRADLDESWKANADVYYTTLFSNAVKAERQIADKLDEADAKGELLPTRELIAISRDAADRTGYGKRTTNLNVNVDFAAKLEAAIRRSGKVIDHE